MIVCKNQDVEKCTLQRTAEHNVQVLFKNFKKEVVTYVHDYACKITPKLDRIISNKEKTLDMVLNDVNMSLEEKQLAAGILDEEIQNLEKQRHTKA